MTSEEDVERWLKTVPVIGKPSDEQAEALRGLFGSVGLTTLLGLCLGARQGLYAFLSNQPIGGPEADCAAAVTQGKIRGLELVFDTVREIAVSAHNDDERIES